MWRVLKGIWWLWKWLFLLLWKVATWFYVAVGFSVLLLLLVVFLGVRDEISSLDEEEQEKFSTWSKRLGFEDWTPVRDWEALPDRFVVRYSVDELLSRLEGEVGGSPYRYVFSQGIEELARDERVLGVQLDLGLWRVGITEMQFLSRALLPLYERGKKVYVHGGHALSMTSHALFQRAESLWIAPIGILGYEGYGFEEAYISDLLDLIGLKAVVVKEGRYKTASDWLIERGATPFEREQVDALLDDWYLQTKALALKGGRIGGEGFEALVEGGMYTSDEALAMGMVDGVGYESEFDLFVEDALRGECGELCEDELAFVDLGEYIASYHTWRSEEVEDEKRIAYVSLSGAVYSGPDEDSYFWGRDVGINASYWKERLEDLGEEEAYEGVVVRIASPGGEAGASDEMWWALKRLNEKKPVVVVIDEIAASGGYYMAVAGERIVIERGALTGSIGVLLSFLVQEELSEMLGVNWERFARGRFSTLFSPNRYPDEESRALMEKVIGWSYENFVKKVAEGRGMGYEEVDSLAQGRIWSGEEALLRGLADEEGGVMKATEVMRELLLWEEDEVFDLVVEKEEGGIGDVFEFLRVSGEVVMGLKQVWVEVLHALGVGMDGRGGMVMMRVG